MIPYNAYYDTTKILQMIKERQMDMPFQDIDKKDFVERIEELLDEADKEGYHRGYKDGLDEAGECQK